MKTDVHFLDEISISTIEFVHNLYICAYSYVSNFLKIKYLTWGLGSKYFYPGVSTFIRDYIEKC